MCTYLQAAEQGDQSGSVIVTNSHKVPDDIDAGTLSPARMYDYFLGGKDNFQADRGADIKSGDWALRSSLPLGPIPTAVPCARAHTTQVLWEWGMAEMSDTAELIVSELITNAITASRALDDGPSPIRFWILSDKKRVLILVWDASPNPPVRMQSAADAEGGRGLMLVDAISTQWAWYPVADKIEGKVVWALISQ